MTTTALEARPWGLDLEDAVRHWHDKRGAVFTAAPAGLSPVPEGTSISAAQKGAEMLGLELTPQGVQVAAVLEARNQYGLPLYDDVTIQIPRRATKTTSIQLVLLGRCATRPGYRVIQTAQDGTRASGFFMDMVRAMERVEPDEEARDWRVFKSTGREYLEWSNGSRWWVVPPKASSFRGGAADVLWFDEAGELDPDESDDLEAGALPVMDTREDGQVIKSGTPGLVRAGLFFKSLAAAHAAPDTLGLVDYSARDSEVVDVEGMTEDQVQGLLLRVHPGLACGLTSMAKMLKRFATMDLAKFIREYLCVWPPDTSTTALDLAKYAETEVAPAQAPEGTPWALGYNVAIGGVAAAVAAAWFDDNGHPHVQVMEYRVKTDWLVEDLAKALKACVPLAYDNIGDNIAIAQALGRRPRTNTKHLRALQLREVAAGTATIASAVDSASFFHGASQALDRAVQSATWRDSGGSRLFRRIEGADISALLACVHALAAASTLKKRRSSVGYAPITE